MEINMESMEEKRRNQKIDKLIDSTDRLFETTDDLLVSVNSLLKTGVGSRSRNGRDRFLVTKDIKLELMKKDNSLLGKIFETNRETLKYTKKLSLGKFLLNPITIATMATLYGLLKSKIDKLRGKASEINEDGLFKAFYKSILKSKPIKALLSPIDNLIKMGSSKLIDGVGDLFKKMGNFGKTNFNNFIGGLGDLVKDVGKFGKSKYDNFVKPIKGFLTDNFTKVGKVIWESIGDFAKKPLLKLFGNFAGKAGGILGKFGGKLGGKLAMKTGTKTLLKKIPGVGSIVGLIFGIERFKKGDVVGGIGEIASGLTSLLPPGIGTAIGLAIDGLLLMKDLNVFGDVNKKAGDLATKAYNKAKDIPVIGQIIKANEAIVNFIKNPMKHFEELANVANSFLPGTGDFIMKSVGWIFKLGGHVLGGAKEFGSDFFGMVKGGSSKAIGELLNPQKKLTGIDAGLSQLAKGGKKVWDFGKGVWNIRGNFESGVKNAVGAPLDFLFGNKKTKTPNNLPTNLVKRISTYDDIINQASKEYNVDKNLIKAVIAQESRGYPNLTSKKGAQGLMQLMPATAKDLGVTNAFDIKQNIFGGTKYLAQMQNLFDNDRSAIAAYNAGPGNVKKYGGIPPFKETQNYVPSVEAYKKLFEEQSKTQINQTNALNSNMRDVGLKIENMRKLPVELSSKTINELSEKIAEKSKKNVPSINTKQSVVVNGRD
jgi:hypothetical protein